MVDEISGRAAPIEQLQVDIQGEAETRGTEDDILAEAAETRPADADTVERSSDNPFLSEIEETEESTETEDASELAEPELDAELEVEDDSSSDSDSDSDSDSESEGEGQGEPEDRGDEQEEDRPGAGWVAEEQEQPESEEHQGAYEEQALGDETRCHGAAPDGSRCLRKAVDGTAYCQAHRGVIEPGDFQAPATADPIPDPDPAPIPLKNLGSKIIV